MPIFGRKQRFSRKNVEAAPNQPGVYALLVEGEVAYYGCTRGSETIRSRLGEHLVGRQAPGRDEVRLFSFEVTRFPLSRECALLEEHKRNNWRLPIYNRPDVRPPAAQPDALSA